MSNKPRSPFALRFATPALPVEDISAHHRSASVKGMTHLSETELAWVSGAATMEANYSGSRDRTPGTWTMREGGHADSDGGDYGVGIDW